jgi:hypothetical protein
MTDAEVITQTPLLDAITDLPTYDQDLLFWEEQLARLLQMPLVWALNADELIKAFELVSAQAVEDNRVKTKQIREQFECLRKNSPPPVRYPIIQVGRIARMLGGYVLETLFKGVAINLPDNLAGLKSKDRATMKRLFHHELRKLAKEAGVTLSENETLLCERLEQYTVWAGRYPAPKDVRSLLPRQFPDGSISALTTGSIEDFATLRALIARVRTLLPPIDWSQPYNSVVSPSEAQT